MGLIHGSKIFCGAGVTLANGVAATIYKNSWLEKDRILVLGSDGGIASFVMANTLADNPFAQDDFGSRLASASLGGFASGTKIMEVAASDDGEVRVRLSNGYAFGFLEKPGGALVKTAEFDSCLKITKHGFYTWNERKFIKTADGPAGGIAPILDGGLLYVIEGGDQDYHVTMRYDETTDSYDIYVEDYKIYGTYNEMPRYAFRIGGVMHIYLSDGRVVNTETNDNFPVDACGWVDLDAARAIRSFMEWASQEHSLTEILPQTQGQWYDDHGSWAEPAWQGIGVVGVTLDTPLSKRFLYRSPQSWTIPRVSGGFYIKDGVMHTEDGSFQITSATGADIMQMIEGTSFAFPTGGVSEMTVPGSIHGLQCGFAGNRWVELSPSDFIA